MRDKNTQFPSTGVPPDLLEALFNSVSEGVFAIDRDFRITAINDAALRTLGLPRHRALGRPCREVFRSNLCGDDCPLSQAFERGVPQFNNCALIKDSWGQNLPVTLSTALVRDARGEVVGGVETFVNLEAIKDHFRQLDAGQPLENIVSSDPVMRQLLEILPTIARSATTILINGETGSGKNLIARAIHNLSARADGPMITVNCAALPETLLEAELFGHKAGAFTGAVKDRAGRLAAAEGGTLFLDEVGDIPLSMQVKLLRVLQERSYERLGDQTVRRCDVRFLTATNRDLEAMVHDGLFRRDLYYRINVLNVDVPPLRARKGDIPRLIQRFIDRMSLSRGKEIRGISSAALEMLMRHDYPGNVRELENIIEHAWVMCRRGVLDVEHLPRNLRWNAQPVDTVEATGLARAEARYLLQVLERHHGHRGKAARELGIHRTTLQRKIKKLGLHLPERDGRHGE